MVVTTHNVIFSSLGTCIEFNKAEFVELLKVSGVPAELSNSTEQLVDLYLQNVRTNPALMLGSAYFIAYHTTDTIAFDGQKNVDNDAVHNIGRSLYSYFGMSNSDEEYSNVDWGNVWGGVRNVAGGLQQGGVAGGIGAATESIGDAVDRKRNPQKYAQQRQRSTAGVDMLQQQQKAKQQMIQSALAAEKAKAEAAAKIAAEQRKKKTITYVAVGAGVLLLVGVGVFLYIRSQKK